MFLRFRVDSGLVELIPTSLLSQKTFVGPSKGNYIILSVYLRTAIQSIAWRIAIYSKPKIDDSTVFYLLVDQNIEARLTNIRIPVVERRIT